MLMYCGNGEREEVGVGGLLLCHHGGFSSGKAESAVQDSHFVS